MNDNQEKLALVVAETILANTKLLQSLVDTLPKQTVAAIEDKVTKVVKSTPVKEVVQVVSAPVVVAPVEAAPVVTVEAVAVPTVAVPAVVEAPATPTVVAPSGKAPFTNQAELTKFVMKRYTELGPIKGAGIQTVLTNLGYKNINDIKSEHYDALFAQVSAL